MNMHESPLPPPDEFPSIVGRLRSMPPPAVPDELQAALVSAIPVRAAPLAAAPMVSAWAKARGSIAGGMVTAAAVAALLFSSHARPNRVAQKPNSLIHRVDSHPIAPILDRNPQETDPCNILPPLGNWR